MLHHRQRCSGRPLAGGCLQVYEDTSGLTVGDIVIRSGKVGLCAPVLALGGSCSLRAGH